MTASELRRAHAHKKRRWEAREVGNVLISHDAPSFLPAPTTKLFDRCRKISRWQKHDPSFLIQFAAGKQISGARARTMVGHVAVFVY